MGAVVLAAALVVQGSVALFMLAAGLHLFAATWLGIFLESMPAFSQND